MQFTTFLATLAVAAVTTALPFEPFNGTFPATNATRGHNATLERRQTSGKATYYNTYYPTFSSCGDQPQDTDMIAALSASYMPSACGKTIAVTNQDTGISINVKVVDTCVACSGGSVAVDLTPSAFEAAGASLDAGTFSTTWSFV